MNWKRALGIAFTLYLVTFVFGILLALLLGIDMTSVQETPLSMWIVSIIMTTVFAGLAAFWYFNKEKAALKDGFFLGLVFIGFGFFMDLLFFIPMLISGEGFGLLGAYYGNVLFWVSLVLVVVVSSCIGKWKGK
jgi:hypothetical protein